MNQYNLRLRRDVVPIIKVQERERIKISEIKNMATASCTNTLISPALYKAYFDQDYFQIFKYLKELTRASPRGLFNYRLKDETRNNRAKLIVKHFNTSVVLPIYPINKITTWNARPNELVTRRTVNSFKKWLNKHSAGSVSQSLS